MIRKLVLSVVCAVLAFFVSASEAAVIDCTEAAWENALARCSNGDVITFNCAAGTIIPITPSRYANRVLNCANVTIDGQNKVTFDMTPPWWVADASFCSSANCGAPCSDSSCLPTQCPTTGGSNLTNQWVINFRAPGSTMKNLTYRYFMEGIHAEAASITIDHVTGVNPGDDNFSNPPNGSAFYSNIVIQNSTFNLSCDKMLQLYGNQPAGSSTYDVRLINNTVTNSGQPARVSGYSGRYYFEGNTFQQLNPPSSLYNMNGPRFGDDGDGSSISAIVHWKNNRVLGTRRGLRMTGYSQLISEGGNTYSNNGLRGVLFMAHARGVILQDTFTNNGGSTSSEDGFGGLAVTASAVVNAGGGAALTLDGAPTSSGGGNSFIGNRSSTDATLDVYNVTTSSVAAQNNWWGDTDPSDQVAGTVSFTPFLGAPPQAGAPPTVDNLHRVDRH